MQSHFSIQILLNFKLPLKRSLSYKSFINLYCTFGLVPLIGFYKNRIKKNRFVFNWFHYCSLTKLLLRCYNVGKLSLALLIRINVSNSFRNSLSENSTHITIWEIISAFYCLMELLCLSSFVISLVFFCYSVRSVLHFQYMEWQTILFLQVYLILIAMS